MCSVKLYYFPCHLFWVIMSFIWAILFFRISVIMDLAHCIFMLSFNMYLDHSYFCKLIIKSKSLTRFKGIFVCLFVCFKARDFIGDTEKILLHLSGSTFCFIVLAFNDVKVDQWVQLDPSILKFSIHFLHYGFSSHWWSLSRFIM